LVASNDLRPGIGEDLFSEEKISKEKVEEKRITEEANDKYSTKINKRINGTLLSGVRTGQNLGFSTGTMPFLSHNQQKLEASTSVGTIWP